MKLRTILPLAALALTAGHPLEAGTRLLRFPDVHGDRVVFTYAGDLWTASTSGGLATRLTAHPGLELFAKFSPDGSQIAFTGQYDGDEQVYVIPSRGGTPKRLSWYPARGPLAPRWGYDDQVYGWTPDGDAVLFRSTREYWGPGEGRLYTVPVTGGLPVALPMPQSGAGDLAADGHTVAYSPLFRDFRTWKRYQGGWAQDLYLFDLETESAQRVTTDPRTDRDPMWVGDTLYFASDRDDTLNLYAWDRASGETRQVTHEREWDVRWPSADGVAQIVYELDGELSLLDTRTGESRHLEIEVPDDAVAMRPRRVSAKALIEDFSLSPKGERALFVARGDVFTAPIEHGFARNLTDSSTAHDRWARWSPDGRQIAYISDATGEEELYVVPQDGSGPPQALTSNGRAMRYAPEWSPDGARIAFADKDGKIHVLTLADRALREVADESRGQAESYVWSPDGRFLAFALSVTERTRSIFVWSAADGETRRITGELTDEHDPAWGTKGDYLYYLSEREYAPQISNVEWNFAGDRTTGIFAMALRKDVPHPFPPRSDEVAPESEPAAEKDAGKKEAGGGSGALPDVRIDFDGLSERVARVPVAADDYAGLTAKDGHLLYARTGAFFYGRSPAVAPSLRIFSLEKREEKTLAEEIGGYALSADGSKVLVQQQGAYALYDATPEGAGTKKAVATDGLMADVVPAQEWRTMFDEVWRRYRDFFYVANMHGYDWEALRERYSTLLDDVGHRSDLNYVVGEMIAELSVGHAYISGGDWEQPERPRVALLGAELELDAAAGRYRIARILDGQNEEEKYRSPLTEVGVDVREGDYLMAIDGEDLAGDDNPYRLLAYKADRPVRLTVSASPSVEGARDVSVRPISDESDLRYLAWVSANRKKVEEATGGRAGYLHLPDMGADGISEFIKWFYPQIRRQGLVIDVRGNGGGNVSQMIIARLSKKLLGTRFSRTNDHTGTYPVDVFHGHLVCLLNEVSASDGDIFPARFREAGLGPLIGKRSWGGVVGITSHGPLLDGGDVRVPEFSTNDVNGDWAIEGRGVEPDIEVENDVPSVLAGRDPQLERGIEELMKRIEADPRVLPEEPPPPVKTP